RQYISKNLLKGWQSQLRNLSSVENENKKDLERSSAPFEKMICIIPGTPYLIIPRTIIVLCFLALAFEV
ncbi:MAG: hypothetical protein U9N77_00865, partial [Thermodesulfobacteriota bacterium]|nr:hypothetical protein [Thermodesulfobacteriota bacterium]